jgi:hypothetical protein
VSEPQTGARRYPRTFGGLIGSMIVLVLAVVAYWVLQNVTHDQPDGEPVGYDYKSTVTAIQSADLTVAYPSSLPDGWIANGEPAFTPGDRPVWRMAMLTDDERFIGIHQENAPVSDMLDVDLPKGHRQGEDVTIDSDVATTWTSWSSGDSGDHAFTTTVGDDTLVVYGSAPVADIKTLVGLLTTAPAS